MNLRKKEGQVSVEYMFLIGFATIITIPLILIYQTFTQESNDDISSAQIEQVARKIIDSAESMYYLGEPSQTTLKVNIPNNLILVNFSSGYEIVFRIKTKAGEADIVQNSAVNITGSLPIAKGTYTVTVKAMTDHAEVSYR